MTWFARAVGAVLRALVGGGPARPAPPPDPSFRARMQAASRAAGLRAVAATDRYWEVEVPARGRVYQVGVSEDGVVMAYSRYEYDYLTPALSAAVRRFNAHFAEAGVRVVVHTRADGTFVLAVTGVVDLDDLSPAWWHARAYAAADLAARFDAFTDVIAL